MRYELWDKLQNENCRVIINHVLFGEQQYDCESLQIINDEHRLGARIKRQDLFVYKSEILDFTVNDNIYMVKDKWMKITIVNKM